LRYFQKTRTTRRRILKTDFFCPEVYDRRLEQELMVYWNYQAIANCRVPDKQALRAWAEHLPEPSPLQDYIFPFVTLVAAIQAKILHAGRIDIQRKCVMKSLPPRSFRDR
jgi:hypothetical protein